MSTKLYSGLKLKDPITDLFAIIPAVAAAIQPAFEDAVKELVAKELVRFLDDSRNTPSEDSSSSPIFDLETSWNEQQSKYGRRHRLNDPLRFSIVFGKSSRGNTLAYPYYEEPRYGEALESLDLFEDYHYQDQSDQPKEISKKAWKQRGEEWDSIADSTGAYGNLPLWQLSGTQEPFSQIYLIGPGRKFDINSYTTPEKRLQSILSAELIRRAMPETVSSTDIIWMISGRALRIVNEFLRSDEAAAVRKPEPFPLSLSFRYSDLPAAYEPDPELIDRLYAELTEYLNR